MSDSFVTLWTVATVATNPLSIGFPRQEYWSGLPFPSPRDLSDSGIKLMSPALQVDSLPLSHQGSPTYLNIDYDISVKILHLQIQP